ncbi:uncharacterized protein KGF55_002205 [Candida pseudojiufengensis]|uniref:uncharacterized protein n=1 Tax=Candida pseudojiufengensis TaxID=497109 RepID=UPI0022245DCC|nr:uncharacterized protein KGF55_002205 [Candida pseudojiufengensis]KAI5964263.1 hypothetical protein KGF55_002205 [Candida pseudojiufengensis]
MSTIIKKEVIITSHPRRQVGNPIILIIDLISILIGFYGIYTNMIYVELPPHLKDAGQWQFLTNLSLIYSIITFIIGFLAHLFKNQTLFLIKNDLHPIGLALESIVAGVYWPLRLFFLNLLTKDPSKFKMPIVTDLSIHLMPIISLLIDYLVFMPKWTISINTALAFVVSFTTFYWFLLKNLIDLEKGGRYPYEFMNVEKESERIIVFVVVGTVAFGQFLLMRQVYDWVVGKTEEASIKIDKELDKKNL